MKRRAVLGTLAVGAFGSGAGCLSRAREATPCTPTSQFGVLIENHRENPVSASVEIETGLLGRDVFSETFDVSAARRSSERTYHPGTAYESGFLPNLRSYTVSVHLDGETATHSWRVRCRHLYIRIEGEGRPSPSLRTLSPERWDRITDDKQLQMPRSRFGRIRVIGEPVYDSKAATALDARPTPRV